MKAKPRTARLKLSSRDLGELRRMKGGGQTLTARTWRRILTLEHLHAGLTLDATAKAVGGYHREVSRVAKRYRVDGLLAALSDNPRPGGERKLDSVEESAIVALVCGPPPEGNSRWTVRLATSEAMRRGIVKHIGRETIRVTLASHDLKPWREKNVGRAGDQRRVHREDGGRPAGLRSPVQREASGGVPR